MASMKQCKKCGETKPLTGFYAHPSMKDGLDSKCKECAKRMSRENRAANIERCREYDRARFQNDPKVRARHKRYQQTDAGKKSIRKSTKRWRAKNKDKRAAHTILGNAVRGGRVKKPDKCTRCGSGGRIHGHHEDYSQPLSVIWLCPGCHAKAHR